MRFTEFLLILSGFLALIAGVTFGVDRELARRDFERYTTTQEELIVGCIFEANCNHYNDLLENEE